MYALKVQEKEIEKKVAQDFFKEFDTTRQLGRIDFCVSYKSDTFLPNKQRAFRTPKIAI
ncbi:hypothetical protein [Helicobacter ganmani]|uniref:hypothetical protein n=1 Tax=Helicobacter ganmani TaxID=60246 RepID=UPI003A88ED3E